MTSTVEREGSRYATPQLREKERGGRSHGLCNTVTCDWKKKEKKREKSHGQVERERERGKKKKGKKIEKIMPWTYQKRSLCAWLKKDLHAAREEAWGGHGSRRRREKAVAGKKIGKR